MHMLAGVSGSNWWTQLPQVYLPLKLAAGAQDTQQVSIDHGAFVVDVADEGPAQPCLLAFQVLSCTAPPPSPPPPC